MEGIECVMQKKYKELYLKIPGTLQNHKDTYEFQIHSRLLLQGSAEPK